jgi:hypothetical protein
MAKQDPIEISNIKIVQDEGSNRRAFVGKFENPINFGVHSGVKEFYNIETDEEYPSTLDHIIAAAGG